MFLVGYNHLISNKLKWNNCFIKNNQDIYLLDLIDFAFTRTNRIRFNRHYFLGMV